MEQTALTRHERWLLFGLLLLGLALRLSGYWQAWNGEHVNFQSPDAYYHMRRIMVVLAHPTELGALDFFRGLSDQHICPWPIYHDIFYALFIGLLGFGTNPELMAALLPPLLGTLSGVILFFLCRPLGHFMAWGTLLLFLILPKNISVSFFGEIDHHVAEVLCFSGSLYSWYGAIQNPSKRQIACFSLWLTAMFLAWNGSSLYAGLIALMGLPLYRFGTQHYQVLAQGYLGAAVLLTPLYLFSFDMIPIDIAYERVSLFQPLFLLVIGCFYLALAQWFHDKKGWQTGFSGLLCLSVAILLLQQIWNGFAFIFAKQGFAFTHVIAELQPLHALGWWEIMATLTPFALLTPGLAGWWMWRSFKQTELLGYMLGFQFFASFILTLSGQRFMYLLTVFICPVLVWGLWQLKTTFNPQRFWLYGSACVCMGVGFTLPQTGRVLQANLLMPPVWQDVTQWLRTQTPAAGDWLKPHQRPSYSVLAAWDMGHFLLYRSQRPIVSENFGINTQVFPQFMASQTEAQGSNVIKPLDVRYVVVTPTLIYNPAPELSLAQKSVDQWLENRAINHQNQTWALGYPHPAFVRSIFARLYFQDGGYTSYAQQPALQHLRLVYESTEQVPVAMFATPQAETPYFLLFGEQYPEGATPVFKNPARVKIYERVLGALLTGQTKPQTPVQVETMVKTNTGRLFRYTQQTTSDAAGNYQLRLPYGRATGSGKSTATTMDYQLTVGGSKYLVPVSEAQVLAGTRLLAPARSTKK